MVSQSHSNILWLRLTNCLAAVNVGDEGGFAPNVSGAEESLELLSEAIKKAGFEGKIKIALDVASSEFYKDNKYDLDFKNPNSDPSKWITGVELADLYLGYVKKYPIVSIEDPFDQDDWEAWTHFTKQSGIQIVGDDLTVTNPLRIKTAIEKKACNGLLLKVLSFFLHFCVWYNMVYTGQPNRNDLRIYPSVCHLPPSSQCFMP